MNIDYDILIVGGGPVGATLACALHDVDLKLALVDLNPAITPVVIDPKARALALSYSSQQLLMHYGLWSLLQPDATAIMQVHVSEQGHFGMTRLTAEAVATPVLGYNVPIPSLQNALHTKLAVQKNLTQLRPAKVVSLERLAEIWQVVIQIGADIQQITCRYIVAADGTQSSIRQMQNIQLQQKDYGQTAIAANVRVSRPQRGLAYERFCSDSVVALLPLADQNYGLVWSMATAQAADYLQLDDEQFLQQVQQRMGYRLGKFLQMTPRYSYPLNLIYAKEFAQTGLFLLGNAAQTINPIAAQGFNLGLRDIADLVALLQQPITSSQQLMRNYIQARQQDKQRILNLTDKLETVFKAKSLPIILSRNLGLLACELFSPLKRKISRRGMGF